MLGLLSSSPLSPREEVCSRHFYRKQVMLPFYLLRVCRRESYWQDRDCVSRVPGDLPNAMSQRLASPSLGSGKEMLSLEAGKVGIGMVAPEHLWDC